MLTRPCRWALAQLVVWAFALASSAAAQSWKVVDPLQGAIVLSSGLTGASELSGITWANANQWYAISDDLPIAYPLTVQVDPTSGWIVSAALSSGTSLAAGSDLEGIAFNASNGNLFVSDEAGPAIREYSLPAGSVVQALAIPAVFANVRPNLSLESLARDPLTGDLWTANEEALSVDGPVSSIAAGTVVRLQRFDSSGVPSGQWAYQTDAIPSDGFSVRSGVSDLFVLPDGGLVVFERVLFRQELYRVDFTGATDTSALPALNGGGFTVVGKALLWTGTSPHNFEGVGLGPALTNGDRTLLLVSDNGGGLGQALYPLVLSTGCEAIPRSGCLSSPSSKLTIKRHGGAGDRLVWKWTKGTVAAASDFGDPVANEGTHYDLCLYDSLAGTSRLALSAAVASGAPWQSRGTTGFGFRDPYAQQDGVFKLNLKAGTGSASILIKGKGVNLHLPTPMMGDPLLRLDTSVVFQLVDHFEPTRCFEATYTDAANSDDDQFKAKF